MLVVLESIQKHAESEVMDNIEIFRKQTGSIMQPGLSQEALMKAYEKRQKSEMPYDQQAIEGGYRGPKVTADLMATMVESGDKTRFKILDVGAGTGLVGKELHDVGFRDLYALDPSGVMTKEARNKGVYRQFYQVFMTDKKTAELENDEFDGIVTCGCFVENHIPIGALDEMVRVVKPGGFIVISERVNHLTTTKSDRGSLREHMKWLEENGKWRQHCITDIPGYFLNDDGIAWTFVVL